jgi:hypothetical protein
LNEEGKSKQAMRKTFFSVAANKNDKKTNKKKQNRENFKLIFLALEDRRRSRPRRWQ